MRKGNVPYNSLIRSVLRIPFRQKETLQLQQNGISLSDGDTAQVTASCISGYGDAQKQVFYRALNEAYASGLEPTGLQIIMILPEQETEPEMKERMETFRTLAKKNGIPILGGHTSFSAGVRYPVLTLLVSGKRVRRNAAKFKEGTSILLTKCVGDAGAEMMAGACAETLAERFSPGFLEGFVRKEESLSIRPETEALKDFPCSFYAVSEGGIFSALYRFSEAYGCGFRADIRKIPIHQETVELAEALDLNPYALYSTGSLLVLTEEPDRALELLADCGTEAQCIGQILTGRQKIIVRGEEERFLERPEQDPVYILEKFG